MHGFFKTVTSLLSNYQITVGLNHQQIKKNYDNDISHKRLMQFKKKGGFRYSSHVKDEIIKRQSQSMLFSVAK